MAATTECSTLSGLSEPSSNQGAILVDHRDGDDLVTIDVMRRNDPCRLTGVTAATIRAVSPA